ncbi:hypothetical protein IFM89_018297 [Coptis chinensis]|uniref:DUF4283 domain-containing protein n=1 Tax=Coptis chinensis TaxID=261450 RepID=A0A835GYT4_9MAGN|nr:hypothetical protein IFM89_018297 [Coptis chinensis]
MEEVTGEKASPEEPEDYNKAKMEQLQVDMKNLFSSKEKRRVVIGNKNKIEVNTANMTLLGKLYGGKNISLQELAEELHRCWQTRGKTEIEVVSKGVYKMSFENEEEYRHVRKNGPWVIQGFIMSMKTVKHDDVLEEEHLFDLVDFWIQIYGIPKERINEENVTTVGLNLGKVKKVDLCCSSEFNKPVAQVRVRLDIKERLLKSIELCNRRREVIPKNL